MWNSDDDVVDPEDVSVLSEGEVEERGIIVLLLKQVHLQNEGGAVRNFC